MKKVYIKFKTGEVRCYTHCLDIKESEQSISIDQLYQLGVSTRETISMDDVKAYRIVD